jgi:light-regulated signal transduction histidine kinase (bacteriophytochrome)
VTLYTQYLARQYRGKLDPQADEFIKLTVDGARRLQNLIQDLLSYTKAIDEPDEAGAGSDAEVAMEEVLQNLRTAVELANAEVFYRDLPRVGVRHCQVVQLLQNFVTNALKYRSREAPQIHISAERQGAAWLFTVRDNGMGIAPEHHERIFRVFKRLHGREIPGTGIGLAVCERIVTHYGGRIWVESEAGHGATFYFTLPSAAGRE